MKKILFWAIASATVLATLGCQKEGTDFFKDGDVKEVTTNFVLNVASGQGTKQDATTVQQNSNFRGIQDVHIYTHVTGMDGTPYYAAKTDPAAGKIKEFPLGVLYAANGIDNTSTNNKDNSSKRVVQLSLPLATDAVRFYGKAINASPSAATGKTDATYSIVPSEIEFAVCRRLGSDNDLKDYNATARLMIYVINEILGTSIDADNSGDYWPAVPPATDPETLPAISWKDLGAKYEYINDLYGNRFGMSGEKPTLDPLEEILGNAYSTLTYIKNGEYRAGSSNAIKWQLEDMAKVVKTVQNSTPTTAKEANAKRLAVQILQNATKFFTDTFTYKATSLIKTNSGLSDEAWNNTTTGFSGARDLNKYPYEDFKIPEGAAQLEYNPSTGKFAYLNPNKPLVNQANGTFDPRKYVYPSELFYYANSPIRTSDNNSLTLQDYPNGWNTWMTDAWSGWITPGKVLAETRGVAVRDNIRYGTALLKTSVVFGATDLQDNRKAMTNNAEDNKVIPADESGIQLKGILVGGVCPRYGWQYIRKYEDSSNPGAALGYDFSQFDGVIYDDQIVQPTIPTTVGSETYTLVYDNYDSSQGTAQSNVFVALEFVNTGNDFWGKDNLIRSGATFYLVAELVNDSTNQGSIVWPTDHQIPPVYLEGDTIPDGKHLGESKQIPRVFIQDFMTTATFRIGATSLQKAYFSMPDLRSTQMSLGLSVNLKWEPGYTYSVNL